MKFRFHDTFTSHWRYWFLVTAPRALPRWPEVVEFCEESFGAEGERWTNSGSKIGLKSLVDATHFKLRWCDS